MKRILFLTMISVMVLFSCTKDEIVNEKCEEISDMEVIPADEIRKMISDELKRTGEFSWDNVDPVVVWSAAFHGDGIITVGFSDSPFRLQKGTSTSNARKDIIEITMSIESEGLKSALKEEDVVTYEPETLNYIDLKVSQFATIEALNTLSGIRYIEPSGFEYFAHEMRQKSSSGCDKTVVSVYSSDYITVNPGSLVSWVFYEHNIPQAWSVSTGSGIGVGLIDTGISDDQSLLGSGFESGYSNNRYIAKHGVYVDSRWPWASDTDGYHDKCGHGTLMGATISGPRNNQNLPLGVAYNCNLIAYRATKNVVVDGYHEKRGVGRALTELGNRNDVQIISMSIGHIFSIGSISDAVEYAYSKGKLIIAAGGTSTSFTNWAGVIFPANMDETVAVTGIQDGVGYTECDVCHKGEKIDFTVIMERQSNTNRHSAVLGWYNGSKTYVGGSSVATATTAGIAALIWSNHPTWNRAQVLNRMKESADFYPNRHSDFGWGTIDAYLAVQ
jgi:serine protease